MFYQRSLSMWRLHGLSVSSVSSYSLNTCSLGHSKLLIGVNVSVLKCYFKCLMIWWTSSMFFRD